MKRIAALCVLFLASCAPSADWVRLEAEKANLKLAKRCADGWFQALPFTPDDQRLVEAAFADWQRSIEAEEKLLKGEPR